MKTFTAKDGELRLYAGAGSGGVTGKPYIKILFVNADFTGPIGRNRPDENLVLDRLKFDGNTHFVQGSDAAIAEPLPMSFSFRAFDQNQGTELMTWITKHESYINSAALTTTKGTSTKLSKLVRIT